MNKYIVIGIGLVIILITGYFLLSNSTKGKDLTLLQEQSLKRDDQSSPTSQFVDKQASFAIFTNGTFRVFTAAMYHNQSPNVYIEESNPNIVKVRKAGVTWNDYFSTLPLTLTKDCLTTGTKETFCTGSKGTLKFYLNGERTENMLDQEIKNGDKLLVTFGIESEAIIKQQIDKMPK